ncbi:Dipeptide transport system permease protein DppC [Bacillus sp. ZZV12-4809]|nr:Dipeptide transport system permease protein DppC [Bacillus sp. ZZV12-4809]
MEIIKEVNAYTPVIPKKKYSPVKEFFKIGESKRQHFGLAFLFCC